MTSWPVSEPDSFGCVLWLDRFDKDGYGVSWRGGRAKRAHIAVWEEANGPIPDGMVADHLCSNRACCRLSHIEIVTQRENLFRRSWAYKSRIQKCQRGHNLDLYSVIVPPSSERGGMGRVCRLCNQDGP